MHEIFTGNNLQPPQYQHFHHHYQNTTYSTVHIKHHLQYSTYKTPPTVHIKPLIGNVAFLTQKRRYCNAVSFCALFMLITAFFRFVTNFVSHFKGGWARPLVQIMFIEILRFFLNIIVPFLYFFSKSDQKTTRGRVVSSFPISADR